LFKSAVYKIFAYRAFLALLVKIMRKLRVIIIKNTYHVICLSISTILKN